MDWSKQFYISLTESIYIYCDNGSERNLFINSNGEWMQQCSNNNRCNSECHTGG